MKSEAQSCHLLFKTNRNMHHEFDPSKQCVSMLDIDDVVQ